MRRNGQRTKATGRGSLVTPATKKERRRMSTDALVMVLAGVGIPVLAALNAGLGQSLGSPVAAALVLFCVALTSTGLLFVLTGAEGLGQLRDAPRHQLLAGGLVAFYILSVTMIAPRFGVGNAIVCVLFGQLLSAALVDHFALFGARGVALSLPRLGGLALMSAGVWLTLKG